MRRIVCFAILFVFVLSACSTPAALPTHTPSAVTPKAVSPTAKPTIAPTVDSMTAFKEISFKDLYPKDLHFKEGWSWNTVGVDHLGRVYMGIGGSANGIQDVAVVRYDPATGERKFITTLRTVSQQANNLKPGEEMPKGHTRIIEMNGKMYLGSQGFHEIFTIDPNIRGGHFFEFDEATEIWRDLSATDPEGVSVANQGIIAIDVIPEKNQIIGLGHPSGQITIYDLATQKSTLYTNPDAAQYLGRNIARHIVYSAKYNHIYASFAGSPVLRLDLNTGKYTTLPTANGEFYWGDGPGYDYGNEFVTGMAKNHDGSQIYYVVPSGYFYHFNADTETLTRLGQVLTPDQLAKKQATTGGTTMSLVMSKDEKYLYEVAAVDDILGLYRYNIAAGVWSKLSDLTQKFKEGVYTGGEIDAQGRIYFAHYNDDQGWVNLVQFDVNLLQP